MSRKSQITVTSRGQAAQTAIASELRVGNEVLARRLRSGNLQGGGTIDVPVKDRESLYVRWENQLADRNMFYRMVHELGYEPVRAEDLSVAPDAAGYRVNASGHVVRGDVGHEEMLFKMPITDREALDQVFSSQNKKGTGSAKQIKADAADAAGSALGSEAGDYISGLSGQVVDVIGQ